MATQQKLLFRQGKSPLIFKSSISNSQPKNQAADKQKQNKHQENRGVKQQIAKQRKCRPGKKPPNIAAKLYMTAMPKAQTVFFGKAIFKIKLKHFRHPAKFFYIFMYILGFWIS